MASKFASKGLRPYKTGSNAGYESNFERAAREKKERLKHGRLTDEEMAKKAQQATQFKGFVGGMQFRTKLGFQGNAFDTLWGKHIFLSFSNDDEELFEVAMKSELADVSERVIGGEYGSAFFIGDIGFFAQNQFEHAAEQMREFETKASKGIYFLSTKEWVTVNANIKKLADYSETRAPRAVRGDSWGALALRANAYKVAKRMLTMGMDPMITNEEGEDMFQILEEQYNRMTGVMHDVLVEKEVSTHKILVPSEQRAMDEKEEATIQVFRYMLHFLEEFNASLLARIAEIGEDKRLKRRLELRRESVSEKILFNVSCEAQVNNNSEMGKKLQTQLIERIRVYEQAQKDHVHLADLMHKQHAVVERKGGVQAKKIWKHTDDAEVAKAIREDEEVVQEDDVGGFDGETDDEIHTRIATAKAARIKKEKAQKMKAHGLETDDEKEARLEAERLAEEEKLLMALSLTEEEEREAKRKDDARLERQLLAPIQGTLYASEYETTSYR
mgnify:CR=1 FL=1